jgi:pentatricopeptide repeat protein
VGRLSFAISLLRNRVISIDTVTYNTVISGLCEHGLADEAYQFLSEMVKMGILPDTVSYNTLIDGFCKVGNFVRAKALVDEISELNLITHTILLSSYYNLHAIEEAYRDMVMSGFDPDVVTFSSIINRLCKGGKVLEGGLLLREMEEMSVYPNHVTYTTLVDSLFKANIYRHALALYSQMVVRGIPVD